MAMATELFDATRTLGRPFSEIDFKACRRTLLRGLGYGAIVAAAAGIEASTPAHAQSAVSATDIAILRFALNFEYLGAELYLRVTTGQGLATPLVLGGIPGQASGPVIGVSQATTLSANVFAYAQQLALDEQNHVIDLRNSLTMYGSPPNPRPTIDLQNSFTNAAINAGLIPAGSTFNVSANDTNFLLGAYMLEDVCVTALHGAIPMISNPAILDAISGTMATEAYQAGMIRTALFALNQGSQTQAISYLRARLDGTAGTPLQNNDHGVGTTSLPGLTNGDGNSIVGKRTMTQVLNIAYGNKTTTPGGFFPNGINT